MVLKDGRAVTRTTLDSASEKEKLLVHHKEKHFTAGDVVWDVIIGVFDGLTVPFALATGLSGASVPSSSLPHCPPPPLVDALRSLLQSPSPDAAAVRDKAILSVIAIVVAALPSPLPTPPTSSPSLSSSSPSPTTPTTALTTSPAPSLASPCVRSSTPTRSSQMSLATFGPWPRPRAPMPPRATSFSSPPLSATSPSTASFPPLPPSSPPPPPSFPSLPPNPSFPLPTPIASRLISI